MLKAKTFGLLFWFSLLTLPMVLADKALSAIIDRRVTIQPIQICDDFGANCANPYLKLFEAETDKIWAQAGIDVEFLSFTQFNETDFLNINTDMEFDDLVLNAGHQQNPNSIVLNMWFLNTVQGSYGRVRCIPGVPSIDCLGQPNGIGISNSVFSFNGGIGRFDTIAHELGHALGLTHDDFGAGGSNNLMTAGFARNVPSSIDDIFPDGAKLDQLTAEQINIARNSSLLQIIPEQVPEPSTTLALAGVGLFGLYKGFKSKKNRSIHLLTVED